MVVTFTLKLCNIYLTGALGYWLCMILLSENLLWGTINGARINLMSITIERYLKVVHHKAAWSKKLLSKWVKISAAAFAWIACIGYKTALVFPTSRVVNGVCYGNAFWNSRIVALAHSIWYIISFYVLVICIFIFGYGRILVVIRHQARVMASHSEPRPSTTQNPSEQIQINVSR